MPFVTTAELKDASPDYIIVGGGTAGLALAARLTEDPTIVVLVLEAGVHHGPMPEIDIPAYMGRLIANPKFDWTFLSVPQKHANDRVVLQPRGKGLGGSSLLNFYGIFRPSKDELDAIEELGNPGWNWDSFLHYLKKSSTLQPAGISDEDAIRFAAKPEPEYHGTDGPIKTSFPPSWAEIHLKLFDTAEKLGIQRNPETCAGRNNGAMTSLVSVDAETAKRSYSATAYLEPNLDRKNLLVLTEAHVTRVLFEKEGSIHRARGVELVHNGTRLRLENVKHDVVVCGGTLQTSQILELSGIGNKDILSQHGIETVVDLPGVGENMQDHVCLMTVAQVDTIDETVDVLSDPVYLKKHEELYKQRKGLLASVPAPGFIFLSANDLGTAEEVASWQDRTRVQNTEVLAKVVPALRSGLEKQYRVHQRLFADKCQSQAELLHYAGHAPMPGGAPEPGKHYATLICALMHPLSRGTVHVASADPLAPPAIDPNYFANDVDLEVLVNIVEKALQLFNTAPLSEHVKQQVFPVADAIAKGRDGLREYVKTACGNVFHPVGTAAMMPREDGGVVDASLKVYGTSNLRVVDLSVIPMELSCHTQAIAYAVGEKAADIFKAERKMSASRKAKCTPI